MRSVRGSQKAWAALRSKKRTPEREPMACYDKRDDLLITLGYSSYSEYLGGKEWKEIRGRKLARYRHCVLCGKVATEVHHMDYQKNTLLGLRDYRLVQLCRVCHHKIEFGGTRKRTVREATGELFKMAATAPSGIRWMAYQNAESKREKVLRKRERKKKMRKRK